MNSEEFLVKADKIVPVFSADDFIAFCKTKGDEAYRMIDGSKCPITQFGKSRIPECNTSRFKSGELFFFKPSKPFMVERQVLGILKLSEDQRNAICRAASFDELVIALEK